MFTPSNMDTPAGNTGWALTYTYNSYMYIIYYFISQVQTGYIHIIHISMFLYIGKFSAKSAVVYVRHDQFSWLVHQENSCGRSIRCDAIRWYSFCGDVVSDIFNETSRDEDNILDQIYKGKYVRFIIIMTIFILIRKYILKLQKHQILWVSC